MTTKWIIGLCWRCDAEGIPVLWLGPVQTIDYGHAPFSCCEPCVRRLEALTLAHNSRGQSVA
ncbi:hypothetical protein ACFWXA_30945 [Streptomyces atroolivaceus]|uniref:hypothetical protein n=1 Tax=Streptomyces atroolivaceus TaxID=66869 RepID=UPI0036651CD2